jgi:hypothetical protein
MFANAPKGKQAYVYYYYDMQNRVYKQINLPPVLRNGDKVLLPESEGEPYGVMVYENDLPADQSIF